MLWGLGRALAADAHDGRMRQVGAKPLLGAQSPAGVSPPERLERAEGNLLLRAALAANEMAMSLDVRAMPSRHAIVEMGVSHIPEILKGFEVAVDRRGIDLRMARADVARDLFRRGVMPRALERVEHQTALNRHPLSLRADLVGHAHAPTVRQVQASCKSHYRDNLR